MTEPRAEAEVGLGRAAKGILSSCSFGLWLGILG